MSKVSNAIKSAATNYCNTVKTNYSNLTKGQKVLFWVALTWDVAYLGYQYGNIIKDEIETRRLKKERELMEIEAE